MKTKMLYEIAMPLANHIREVLAPHCARIETVGSLRRNKAEVGDIELLAIPNPSMDMFGTLIPLEIDHALNHVDYSQFGTLVKGGSKYKKIALTEGIDLDLFICTPPAQYGVLKLIRTGSADFSQKFVTKKAMGGYMPGHMKVENGALWEKHHQSGLSHVESGYALILTPEEEDVFHAVGLDYIEPNAR